MIEKSKFFAVDVKAGHVGNMKYTEVTFYVAAGSKKEAAQIARWLPRVKHHAKDAISNVTEITREDYDEGRRTNRSNEFLNAKNVQQQRASCVDLVVRASNCNTGFSHSSEDDLPEARRTLQEKNPRKYYIKYKDYYEANSLCRLISEVKYDTKNYLEYN